MANQTADPSMSEVSLDVTEGASITLSGLLQNPLLWSAEEPNLYILVISLYSSLKDAEDGKNVIG
jgi:beta-galactosidase/beta-glucuronidase